MDVLNFILSNGYSTGTSSIDVLVKRKLVCTSWSSTEANRNNAWIVSFSDGNTTNNNKYNSNSVRAVAALDEKIKIGWIDAFNDCCAKKKSSPQCNAYRIDYEFDLWILVDEIYQRKYAPSISTCFMVTYPKLREIFAAHFRDRIVQHWISIRLEPLFEKRFHSQGNVSFNCRKNFGTLKAVNALEKDIIEVSHNYTVEVHVGRFDLKSFFMSIDLTILWKFLKNFIIKEYKEDDIDTLLYLTEITIFHRPQENCYRNGNIALWDDLPPHKSLFNRLGFVGMAIGNLTSQQFANFYMSFFDEFMIWICARYKCRYERFVDDFTVVGNKNIILKVIRPLADQYLAKRLKVSLHHDKFYIQPVRHGVKFVGTVIMPGRKYISNRTVGGMINKLRKTSKVCTSILRGNRNSRNLEHLRHCIAALNSYLGFMVHVNGHNLRRKILNSAPQDFWDVCYVQGDYTVIKIKKRYQLTTFLKEQEDAENDFAIRQLEAISHRDSKALRNENPHHKLRHNKSRRRKL